MLIAEDASNWTISFDEAVISAIQIDFRISLTVLDRQDVVQVVIETPFSLIEEGKDDHWLNPSHAESLAPILSSFNTSVEYIKAGKNGELRIAFASGGLVQVIPNETYESWQVSSPGDYLLTCEPGGRVSFFVGQS